MSGSLITPEAQLSKLERLPNELLWMLFDHIPPRCIGGLRLASNSMKAIVDAWSVPRNLPDIYEIEVTENDRYMNVTIRLLKQTAPCFVKLRELFYDSNMQSKEYFSTREEPYKKIAFDIPYVWNLLAKLRHMNLLFLQCYEMDNACEELIRKLLCSCSIAKFDCLIERSALSNPGAFLLALSEKVKSIEISQNSTITLSASCSFLNAKNMNWVDLVVEMFNKGTTFVKLHSYNELILKSTEVEKILKWLVSRGDDFIFSTLLNDKPTLSQLDSCKLYVMPRYDHNRLGWTVLAARRRAL